MIDTFEVWLFRQLRSLIEHYRTDTGNENKKI